MKTSKTIKFLLLGFLAIGMIVLIFLDSFSLNDIKQTENALKRHEIHPLNSHFDTRNFIGDGGGDGNDENERNSENELIHLQSVNELYNKKPYNVLSLSSDGAFSNIMKKWKSSIDIVSKNKLAEREIRNKKIDEAKNSKDYFTFSTFKNSHKEANENEITKRDTLPPIVLHSTCQTKAGFISSLKSKEAKLFLGSSKLIKNNRLEIQINNRNAVFYPLESRSRVFNLGKTSSCIIKKKSPLSPKLTTLDLTQLCNFYLSTTSQKGTVFDDLNFMITNEGESPSIHLEQACISHLENQNSTKMGINTEEGLSNGDYDGIKNSNIKYYSYKEDILQQITTTLTKNKNDNQIYHVPLSFYTENKNHVEEILINNESCTSLNAPLISDVFLFVNDFTHKHTLEFCSLLSSTLGDEQQTEISKNRLGFIKYNFNFLSQKENFYPLLSE